MEKNLNASSDLRYPRSYNNGRYQLVGPWWTELVWPIYMMCDAFMQELPARLMRPWWSCVDPSYVFSSSPSTEPSLLILQQYPLHDYPHKSRDSALNVGCLLCFYMAGDEPSCHCTTRTTASRYLVLTCNRRKLPRYLYTWERHNTGRRSANLDNNGRQRGESSRFVCRPTTRRYYLVL